jgi:hypothetical protein
MKRVEEEKKEEIIYNYEIKSYYTDPSLLIPINTMIQIKEPYLQQIGF